MSRLLVHAAPGPGPLLEVTPESAGWRHVGFTVAQLPGGQVFRCHTADRELCLVVVEGRCHVRSEHGEWRDLGERADPFSGRPHAAYLPPNTALEVEGAAGGGEVALCFAPARSGAAARILESPPVEIRGRGAQEREVRAILMGDREAEALLVCEVLTPAGHWSSYPPHKHDRDALPDESYLEETYYHRVRPSQGFALQRVYTGDGELDETLAVRDRDVVLVPRGYHTVSAPPGYEVYYLNVMAGPTREWAIANDPDHEWLLQP
ncbi:MAG: 5-deoxy-glucuronate isomerase [Solirubrobacterales bacterium]|nr:5-deoxy-glucuronate isomerase [Solirubrobacterales bacterium]